MKKNVPFLIVYIIAFIVTFFNLGATIKESLFSDISSLPVGDAIASFSSPNADKVITTYLINNSLGSAVRGEVKFKDGSVRNVFWQTDIENVDIVWQTNNVAVINSIPIDVSKGGYYDCRRGKSLFQSGAIEGEGFVDEQGDVIPKTG